MDYPKIYIFGKNVEKMVQNSLETKPNLTIFCKSFLLMQIHLNGKKKEEKIE